MSSYYSAALEFSGTKNVEKLPDWIKESSKDIQCRKNYCYIKWDSSKCEPEKLTKRALKELDCSRVCYITGNDTADVVNIYLYELEDNSEIKLVEKKGGHPLGIDSDFGGVFGEDTRTLQKYFKQEHNFKLEFYYSGGLTNKLEEANKEL